jgi:hypothetical protein
MMGGGTPVGENMAQILNLYQVGMFDDPIWIAHHPEGEPKMSLGTILLIILVLTVVGIIPIWPHSRSWGYAPSGGVGLVLIILVILMLMGTF